MFSTLTIATSKLFKYRSDTARISTTTSPIHYFTPSNSPQARLRSARAPCKRERLRLQDPAQTCQEDLYAGFRLHSQPNPHLSNESRWFLVPTDLNELRHCPPKTRREFIWPGDHKTRDACTSRTLVQRSTSFTPQKCEGAGQHQNANVQVANTMRPWDSRGFLRSVSSNMTSSSNAFLISIFARPLLSRKR